MVADQNHRVHAFNTQPVEDVEAIVYRQWALTSGWTEPIDVLLSPREGRPRTEDVFLDSNGIIHLIFFAGNELGGAVYYSKAPAVEADNARYWTPPALVGANAGVFGSALIGDDDDNLYIVYEGTNEGIGLYEVHSEDAGETWSEPAVVSLVYDENRWPTSIHLDLDSQGHLHAVWSVWGLGTGVEVAYARLDTTQLRWSDPVTLATKDPGDYEADWPTIAAYNDQLIVIYQDDFPATKYMRRSFDGGRIWTEPVRPFSHIGEYGSPVLLTDSDNNLHIILGNRAGDCCHGMWHGVWLGERWSELQPLDMGPKTLQFDPTQPKAVISQGNVLLATWDMDSADPPNGVWYSYGALDASELSVEPLPTLPPTPTRTPTVTPTPLPATPTPPARSRVVDPSDGPVETSILDNPAAPVLISIVPIAFLVVIVIVVQRWRH